MGRPIQIDRAAAVRKAADVFWRRGYVATSLNDLELATGMGKGSFYAAFGSKQALFESIVESYHQRSVAVIREVGESKQGLAALEEFLRLTMIDVPDAKRRRGCLLVNSVVELDGVHSQLYRRVRGYLLKLEGACLAWLEEARAAGELRADLAPSALAPLVASLLHGLRVDSRLGQRREALRAKVETFVALVGAPGKTRTEKGESS